MSIVVFLGPSLPRQEAETILAADYRPPVRQGDVYRVVQEKRPSAIAIVDGYFQEVPSVWHKEILWALDQDIPVYGAASMGALRAAELERYGMQGVGRIFDGFRNGVYPPYDGENFEDDDEVAVIHGPAELGFPALSDSMVDLRSTFARAAEEGVIDEALRDRLVAAFKERFYHDRNFMALPDVLAELDASAAQSESLHAWLAAGRVEQKHEDAMALLGLLAAGGSAQESAPAAEPFVFEPTTLWAQFVEASADRPAQEVSRAEGLVLDELRLDPDLYDEVRPIAALRHACLSGGAGAPLGEAERRAAVDRLRRRNGLWSRDALTKWAKANNLDRAGFDRLIEIEARIAQQTAAAGSEMDAFLLDVLRADGRYERLARRAADKAERETSGELQSIGQLTSEFLVDWYFNEHLGRGVPHDLSEVPNELGFATFEDFVQALAREYCFLRRGSSER